MPKPNFFINIFFIFLYSCATSGNNGNLNNQVQPRYLDAAVQVLQESPVAYAPSILQDTPSVPLEASLEPSNWQNGEIIVPLRQDARAPFNGVLFNGAAVARISVEYRNIQERCMIDRRRELDLLTASYRMNLERVSLSLQSQQRINQVVVNAGNEEIMRLNGIITRQLAANRPPHIAEGLVWAGGGLLLGAAIFGGILIYTSLLRP